MQIFGRIDTNDKLMQRKPSDKEHDFRNMNVIVHAIS